LWFITACLVLVISLLLVAFRVLYLPHFDQRGFMTQLLLAGYGYAAEHAAHWVEPPFADLVPKEYHLVPTAVDIGPQSDLSLLPKIGANPHVTRLFIHRNLSVDQLNHFRSMELGFVEFSGHQDPSVVLASALDLQHVQVSVRLDPSHTISPEWLQSWLDSDLDPSVGIIGGSDPPRSLLPLVLSARSFFIQNIPLTESDLRALSGSYGRLTFGEGTGVKPEWIPSNCEGQSLKLQGYDARGRALDPLMDQFGLIRVEGCDTATVERFRRSGVELRATFTTPNGKVP